MNNIDILKQLDHLLEDFNDVEKTTYYLIKNYLEEGITYKIKNLKLSDKKPEFIPLNLIKPFFKMFHKSSHGYYQAKYKKRQVLTNFRGELDLIPLCLEDTVEFLILQDNKILFKKQCLVCELLQPESLIINDTTIELAFKIKLINSENRKNMEQELDSSIFLSQQLEQNKNVFKNLFNKKQVDNVNIFFAQALKIENFNVKNLTVSDLKNLSNDVLVLNKLIINLKYYKINYQETKDILQYKIKLNNLLLSLEKELVFQDNQVVLNYSGGK
jgi:hypothetical protein